jgi:cell division protein FtsB
MKRFDWHSEGFRRVALLAGILAVIALVVHGIFGANGLVTLRQKRREYQTLRHHIQRLKQENQRLEQQVQGLKSNPETIGRYAREELHMAKPGEIIYVVPPPPTSKDSKAAPAAAAKNRKQ